MKDTPKILNLEKSEWHRPIYRITSTKYLFKSFDTKSLSFSQPKNWEDSHENVFLRQHLEIDGQRVGIGFKDQFYGQSWSFRKESDALWRLYGDGGQGVKVATTVLKLFQAMQVNHHFSYIGKVRYLKRDQLRDAVSAFVRDGEANLIGQDQAIGPASTLLIKRFAFIHEHEARALVFDADGKTRDQTRISVSIDPFTLFDQVTFGPRLGIDEYHSFRDRLRGMGYQGPVIRSTLYDAPNVSTKD